MRSLAPLLVLALLLPFSSRGQDTASGNDAVDSITIHLVPFANHFRVGIIVQTVAERAQYVMILRRIPMEMKRRAYLADKFGPDSLGRVVEDFDAELARAKLEVYFDHGPMEVFYFDRTGEFLRNGRRFPLNYALLELFLSPFNPELWHTEYLPVPATDAPQEHH